MRLGLFGGSFDPVHYGHLLLAESAREQLELEQVLFLPAAVPPHKLDRTLSPVEQRIEMLELATAGHEAFAVSDFEARQEGVCYTVDTLRHFREADPEGDLFFLLGADMLHDLPNWRNPTDVCELAIPVGVRRPGSPEPDLTVLAGVVSPARLEEIQRQHVEMPAVDLSSTVLRQRAARGQSIRYQTPRAVERYIQVQGLYAVSAE
ncbi:MAG: nicotinate-nucleotide adenylyltransferase [Pirellulales bacterium]|nr:nicotinate-nucleotide adenylyltransferase [Pirellulales bacterium]